MNTARTKKNITLLAIVATLMVGGTTAHADVIYDDGAYSAVDACRGAVGSSFYDALSPHGQWRYSPRLGWVWSPYRATVGATFRPYLSAGHWVHSSEGWMFTSNHSWGWVPFHYGRWYRDVAHGWSWVPAHWLGSFGSLEYGPGG
ncbi:MAG: hypothetical protein JRH20_32815 [Deltaproteobacteria bacterium]|nr:hypothetical protein [Deltaproteobacteria bacterium]